MIVVHRAEPGWFVECRALVLGEQARVVPVEFFVFVVMPKSAVGCIYMGLIDGEMQPLNGKLSFVRDSNGEAELAELRQRLPAGPYSDNLSIAKIE